MKLHNLAALAVAVALSGLTACDRPDRDRVSGTPSPAPANTTAPANTATAPANTAPAPSAPADTAAGKIGDAGITGNVKAALMADRGVDGAKIEVDTSMGNVTLSGKVPDQGQVQRATQIARGVEGVRTVDNRLTAEN
jgi:hyperosmotically inducible protein